MRKIKLYLAASIDGYIARPDGSIDWLTDYPILDNYDYGYNEFYDSIDSIIMGGNSYRSMLELSEKWIYADKKSYVITRHAYKDNKNIYFIKEKIEKAISDLRKEDGKGIWLFGGGEITTLLLNNDLVDEMIITYIPMILGSGIPLFPNNPKESKWYLIKNETFENGVYQVKYALSSFK